MRTKSPRRTWNQIQQALKIAIEGQRHILELLGFNLPTHIRAICLKQRYAGGHFDALGHPAWLQLEVHTNIVVDQNIDLVADDLLKSGVLDFHPINSAVEIPEYIVAAIISRS